MSKRAKRHLRSEYTTGNRAFPKSLVFLTEVPFVAVVERDAGGKVERTVEVKPATLRELQREQVELADALDKLATSEQEVSELAKEVGDLTRQLAEKQDEVDRLNANLEIINKNVERWAEERPGERSPKSHFNRLQEAGVTPGRPGVSGGIPSLGKRK